MNKIQGESEDQLIDLIATYGEESLISYLRESALDKKQRLEEHLAD